MIAYQIVKIYRNFIFNIHLYKDKFKSRKIILKKNNPGGLKPDKWMELIYRQMKAILKELIIHLYR